MLDSHPDLAIPPETHFLPQSRANALNYDAWLWHLHYSA